MTQTDKIITRFAPSPSGELHLGHAYSARLNYDFAKKHGGQFILRIEDIDLGRCNKGYEEQIYEDLKWLGLKWETQVRRQSDHFDDYLLALNKLDDMGLLYPCFCTRKDIRAEIEESSRAPHLKPAFGPEGLIYPGICKNLSSDERAQKMADGIPHAMRIDLEKALSLLETPLYWTDLTRGTQKACPKILGDVVLARKDFPTSYHLSVVVDDHIQKISHVIRGEDLFYASHFHRLLQHLLNLNTPLYNHHALLKSKEGTKFSKREKSVTIKSIRESGVCPEEIDGLIKNYL
ncbi:MAG: tRNA glutamyl-Q(34) synthetase GluQRS [Kordiimonadaceae bacterium]|nr:tRNA glutamyl-Q(34) synthetase GluQRS [Kordiimonadaceae bacterium]